MSKQGPFDAAIERLKPTDSNDDDWMCPNKDFSVAIRVLEAAGKIDRAWIDDFLRQMPVYDTQARKNYAYERLGFLLESLPDPETAKLITAKTHKHIEGVIEQNDREHVTPVTRHELAWAIDYAIGVMGEGRATQFMIDWLQSKGIPIEAEEECK